MPDIGAELSTAAVGRRLRRTDFDGLSDAPQHAGCPALSRLGDGVAHCRAARWQVAALSISRSGTVGNQVASAREASASGLPRSTSARQGGRHRRGGQSRSGCSTALPCPLTNDPLVCLQLLAVGGSVLRSPWTHRPAPKRRPSPFSVVLKREAFRRAAALPMWPS